MQSTKYPPNAIRYFKRHIYAYSKEKDTTVLNYHKVFRNNIDVMYHNGGTYVVEKLVVELALASQHPPPPLIYMVVAG